jgi:DNA-binding SARP family transcriptional activator
MALDQLETASKELPVMDGTKKDICYELGQLAEAMGDRAKAADYYKQIYQVDIGYKDIAQKIEQVYQDGNG